MEAYSASPHAQEHVHHFDEERARRYDRTARQTLPGYEELHNMASSLLHVELGEEAQVLVVGAGTGMELLTLAEHHPKWRLTGVDPSPEMLALALERIQERGWTDRVQLHVGHVHELPQAAVYDAATCLLVIHHLAAEEQHGLLRGVAQRLKRRAPFVLAEMVGDVASPQFQRFLNAWKFRQSAMGASVEEAAQRGETITSVMSFPSEDSLRTLLSQVGFADLERFFTAYFYGGWVTRLQA
jgi:tRNA (cmo5U34)-methyltransferase